MADALRHSLAAAYNDATYYRYLDIVAAILASTQMEWLRDWCEQTYAHEDPTCPPEVREWIEELKEARRG